MTTPQPSNPVAILHPNSASKKSSANNAATPAGPSSAPRSVPSPAAVRGSGKTPSSFKMGGTPMGMSLSGMGLSPFTPGTSGAAGVGGLPGFTPGSLMAGGAGMMPTLSDLGISSKRSGTGGDAERRRKMRDVLRSIGRRQGGVCEEAICRISRRVGFANDVDAEGEEARRRDEGERTVGIAGKDVLIEVEMRGNVVKSVVVAGLGGVGEEEREKAGKVLEGLLVGEEVQTLDGFGRELARVADLDRVGERGVSAFEAVSGVGHSLKRLHERECEVEGGNKRRVLKKRSGRPWIHSRGRIGLGVDYWISGPTPPPKNDDAMDLDHPEEEDPETISSLHLTAETCPASLYPPVRISTDWLGEDLSTLSSLPAKTDSETNDLLPDASTAIPWQDPPPTYTSPPSEEDAASTTVPPTKLPDLRFLANLTPSVIVPYNIAVQMLTELGAESVPQVVKEWHSLLLDPDSTSTTTAGDVRNSLKGEGLVLGKDGVDIQYKYSAEISKAEWGVKLEELPFAHPRMVVAVMPVLRQWVVFGHFVREILAPGPQSSREGGKDEAGDGDLLEALLTPDTPPAQGDGGEVRVTVEISTSPQPTLNFSFPLKAAEGGSDKMASVTVQVMRNGDVAVVFFEGFGEGERDLAGRLARGLEVCGEVGVWVWWIRERGWERKNKGKGKGKMES